MTERGVWSGDTFFRNFQTHEKIPVSDTHFVIRDASGAVGHMNARRMTYDMYNFDEPANHGACLRVPIRLPVRARRARAGQAGLGPPRRLPYLGGPPDGTVPCPGSRACALLEPIWRGPPTEVDQDDARRDLVDRWTAA